MEQITKHEQVLFYDKGEVVRSKCKHCGAVKEENSGLIKYYHPTTGALQDKAPKCISRPVKEAAE